MMNIQIFIFISGVEKCYTPDTLKSSERPSTLESMSENKTSQLQPHDTSQEDCSLLELPSPISRHGSLVGDPQLPVPAEFLDVSTKMYHIMY